MALDPVAVALKFGFLAVLYLFLLWMARSALQGPARAARAADGAAAPAYEDATGMHVAAAGLGGDGDRRRAAAARRDRRGPARRRRLRPLRRRGARAAATRPTSSSRTRSPPRSTRGWSRRGTSMVLEDLGSTNGTYLNGEPLRGPQPLHVGDRIRIGDSEFTFER